MRKLLIFAVTFCALSQAQTFNLLLHDTFNRSNGAPGNGWTDVTGSTWSITSNVLYSAATADADIHSGFLLQSNTFADGKVRIYPGSGSMAESGVAHVYILRYQDAEHYYFAYTFGNGSGITIGYRLAGATYRIVNNNTTVSFPASWYAEFSAVGTSLALQVFTSTGTSLGTATATDSHITGAGQWGIGHYNYADVAEVDGYSVATTTILTAGAISKTSDSATTANLTATDCSGGQSPYTYQWYRSTTSGFTPGAGNMLSGKTSLTLADTGLTTGTPYYYVFGCTDVTPSTVYTAQYSETPLAPGTVIGFIGDSIMAGYQSSPTTTPGAQMQAMLRKTGVVSSLFPVSVDGIGGTGSGDWLSGSSNLNAAISQFQSAGVTTVWVMLGTNDAKTATATPAATYQTNMANIVSALKTAGFSKIVLNYAPYINGASGWNTTSNALLVQYQSAIQAVVAANPGFVYLGDTLAYNWFANNTGELNDGVHPTNTGYTSLGYLWEQAYQRLFLTSQAAFVVVH